MLSQAGKIFWAVLRQRCPRCRKGAMFRGLFTMNDPCPFCGMVFERETGYFLGAMYFSYFLAVVILGLSYLAAAALFPHWNGIAIAAIALVPYPPLMPLVFRYSRVLWVYFDRYDVPEGLPPASHEKPHERQAGRRPNGRR